MYVSYNMTNDILNLSGVQDAREVAVGTFQQCCKNSRSSSRLKDNHNVHRKGDKLMQVLRLKNYTLTFLGIIQLGRDAEEDDRQRFGHCQFSLLQQERN